MKLCNHCGIFKSESDVVNSGGVMIFRSCRHPARSGNPVRAETVVMTEETKSMIKHLRKRRWSYAKIAESLKLPQSSVGSIIRGEK
jgi:hypothetical protein